MMIFERFDNGRVCNSLKGLQMNLMTNTRRKFIDKLFQEDTEDLGKIRTRC